MRICLTSLALAAACLAGPAARAQAPAEALDAAWIAVCAGAQPGSLFFLRCEEILNAGPGSGDRRSEAALGNNLDQLPAHAGNAGERSDDAPQARGDALDGRLAWHLSATLGRSDRRRGPLDAGFDGDLRRIGGGIDYRLGERAVLGIALTQAETDRRFVDDAGRADSRVRSAIGYLNVKLGERVDLGVHAGAGSLRLDLQRRVAYTLLLNAGTPQQSLARVDALALARPSGRQQVAGLALGWRFIEAEGLNAALRLASDWNVTRVDGYVEQGAAGLELAVDRRTRRAHNARIGIDLSRAISTTSAVWIPRLRADWVRELGDDRTGVAVRFAGDASATAISFLRERPDRSHAEIGLGLIGVFPNGVSAFAEVQTLSGHSQLSSTRGSLGIRVEF